MVMKKLSKAAAGRLSKYLDCPQCGSQKCVAKGLFENKLEERWRREGKAFVCTWKPREDIVDHVYGLCQDCNFAFTRPHVTWEKTDDLVEELRQRLKLLSWDVQVGQIGQEGRMELWFTKLMLSKTDGQEVCR